MFDRVNVPALQLKVKPLLDWLALQVSPATNVQVRVTPASKSAVTPRPVRLRGSMLVIPETLAKVPAVNPEVVIVAACPRTGNNNAKINLIIWFNVTR